MPGSEVTEKRQMPGSKTIEKRHMPENAQKSKYVHPPTQGKTRTTANEILRIP